MKHRDLISTLKALGYWEKNNSGPHEKWTNGSNTIAVPRHKEINEITAMKIIKQAQKGKV